MSSSSSLLKIDPESELNFQLSSTEATPKCTMTLSHAGGTTEAVAFKVRSSSSSAFQKKEESSRPAVEFDLLSLKRLII